ncbi:MAG: TraB/GumN family protein [Pseudomonadota bacterium]
MRVFVSLVLICLLAVPSAHTSTKPMEEVVALGKQPGPKLWRVHHKQNELWILGVLNPLPKDMQWDASAVEAVLADADEYIQSPGVSVSVNPVRAVFMLPSLWGVQKNPDKKKLIDVLPASIYERWLVQKAQYIGQDKGVERKRPMLVADELFRRAIEASDLTQRSNVYKAINQAVKKHNIPTTQTGIRRKLEKPRQAIKKFKKSQISGVNCFEKTLNRIEHDLPVMKARAAAWAEGDISAMRALPYEDQNQACFEEVLQSSFAEDLARQMDLVDIQATLQQNWLQAVETALENNSVTFTTLPISELLKADGYMAELSRRGYTVRGG